MDNKSDNKTISDKNEFITDTKTQNNVHALPVQREENIRVKTGTD